MKIEGKEVRDANEELVVQITKSDVRSGATKSSRSCAAARAICRQTGAQEARVHFSRAYVKLGRQWTRFQVPPALRSEIIAFDRGGEFAAGKYTLRPLQPAMRLDAPIKRPAGRKTGKVPQRGNRPKRPHHVVSGVRARMMADWE